MQEINLATESDTIGLGESPSHDDDDRSETPPDSPASDTTIAPLVPVLKHRDVYTGFAKRLDRVHRLVQTMLYTEQKVIGRPENEQSGVESYLVE